MMLKEGGKESMKGETSCTGFANLSQNLLQTVLLYIGFHKASILFHEIKSF